MNKKQKEEEKQKFLEKHKNTKILVKYAGCQITLDEYMKQEGYLRK